METAYLLNHYNGRWKVTLKAHQLTVPLVSFALIHSSPSPAGLKVNLFFFCSGSFNPPLSCVSRLTSSLKHFRNNLN